MSEGAGKERGFKVQDRRRFSAEGEARDNVEAPEPAGSASVPNFETRAAAEESASMPDVTFSAFVVGLSTQALIALGEVEDPALGKRQQDMAAGQQLIDIIAMLREKTRGNLSSDEDLLIEAILFELRMKYVELAHKPIR